MPSPHTPSDVCETPLIPLGLTPADVAAEFAGDMSKLDCGPQRPVPIVTVELDWPLVQLVYDRLVQPFVLVEVGLVPIVTTLSNIAARLTDKHDPARVAAARQDLDAMKFGELPGNPGLSDRECRFARAFGRGVLRFLVGDACMAAFFGAPAVEVSQRFSPDRRVAPSFNSLWRSDEKYMGMLATFVRHKAQEDAYAPFPSAGRTGVSLFLLTLALWEDRRTAPNPNIISAERFEDTWCLTALGAWQNAHRQPDGRDLSGWAWAMDVSGFEPPAGAED